MVKNPPAMQETPVRALGWEDLLERGMATNSSILAWRIPWIEELGGLDSPWGGKESDMTELLTLSLFYFGCAASSLQYLGFSPVVGTRSRAQGSVVECVGLFA